MKILSLDPSMTCTGWALLETEYHMKHPDGELLGAGMVTPEGEGNEKRTLSMVLQVCALVEEHSPGMVVLELPAERRLAWGGFKGQSVMGAATYGLAVGAALAGVVKGGQLISRIRMVPVDSWAPPKAGGKRDKHKQSRVAYAASLYGLDPKDFGPVSKAGNVADAVLLARWQMLRQGREHFDGGD